MVKGVVVRGWMKQNFVPYFVSFAKTITKKKFRIFFIFTNYYLKNKIAIFQFSKIKIKLRIFFSFKKNTSQNFVFVLGFAKQILLRTVFVCSENKEKYKIYHPNSDQHTVYGSIKPSKILMLKAPGVRHLVCSGSLGISSRRVSSPPGGTSAGARPQSRTHRQTW